MKLFNLFISFVRAAPAVVFTISIVLFLFTRLDIYLFLSIVITLGEFVNKILKHNIFKPIMKNKNWPILGYGTRPKDSKNSSQFGDINKPPSKGSYGMPSGHSQTTLTFAVFLILTIIDYHSGLSENIQKYIILFIIFFTLSVLWSRLYLKCHTIQQVLIGSIFGGILGYYGYIYGNKLVNNKSSKITILSHNLSN